MILWRSLNRPKNYLGRYLRPKGLKVPKDHQRWFIPSCPELHWTFFQDVFRYTYTTPTNLNLLTCLVVLLQFERTFLVSLTRSIFSKPQISMRLVCNANAHAFTTSAKFGAVYTIDHPRAVKLYQGFYPMLKKIFLLQMLPATCELLIRRATRKCINMSACIRCHQIVAPFLLHFVNKGVRRLSKMSVNCKVARIKNDPMSFVLLPPAKGVSFWTFGILPLTLVSDINYFLPQSRT